MPINLLGRLIAAGMWEEINEQLNKIKSPELHWNRCDICGRHIAYKDFANNLAIRKLIDHKYKTRCRNHIDGRMFTAEWDNE